MRLMSPTARAALDRATDRQNLRRPWLIEDDALLRRLYPDTPMPALIACLARSPSSIYQRSRTLGVCRSADYLSGVHACRLRRGDQVGADSRFKRNAEPWNAGMKGWQAGGRSAQTQFKAGQVSANTAELGAERIAKSGIRQRKVTSNGPRSQWWQACHALLWEQHHGAIPPGHIVVFIDRNVEHIALDNLQLVTRAENMRRNSIHRYPPEYHKAAITLGWFKKKLRDIEDEESV